MSKGTKDSEVEALAKVSQALQGLDQEAVGRILQWASTRFGVQLTRAKPEASDSTGRDDDASVEKPADVGELFAKAAPKTDSNKALVMAYCFQELLAKPEFASQELNKELKHLGHGIGNITDALQALIDKRPALVIQIRKQGTTRQARKRYKLTREGTQAVSAMIRPASGQ